jgi:peptidoglycan/LPS O-acetylase OafA/YrhL
MVPVEAFIILSGFVTHYAYGSKPHNTRGQILRFYVRRMGAICVSYYLSWAVMLLFAVLACASGSCIGRHAEPGFGHLQRAMGAVASLFMVQSMDPVSPQYPSGPAWTISTIGGRGAPRSARRNAHRAPACARPSLTRPFRACLHSALHAAMFWLLYPKLQVWLAVPLKRAPFALAVASVVGANLAVVCVFFAGPERYYVGGRAYLWLYQWPPLRLCDFVFGMALAQTLVAGHAATEWRGWSLLADGAALAAWAACALLPLDARSHDPSMREGWEPLFIAGTAPLIGLFIFASSCAGGRDSQFARVFRHSIPAGMGQYGLQVYLWHWPLGMIFKGLEIAQTGNTGRGLQGGFLVPYVLCTWLLAAAVSIHFEEPFVRWLRAKVDAWAAADEAATRAATHAATRAGGDQLVGDAEQGSASGTAATALLDKQAPRSDVASEPPTYPTASDTKLG